MKTLVHVASALLLAASAAIAQTPVEDFPSLLAALKQGKDVRAVLHYAHCRLVVDGKDTKSPDAVGGMAFRTFEYFAPGSIGNPKAFITTSEAVLISHPTRGYVYNYVKLKVYEDNAVDILARYLNPTTFEIVMDEIFYGQISSSGVNRGAYFFVQQPSTD